MRRVGGRIRNFVEVVVITDIITPQLRGLIINARRGQERERDVAVLENFAYPDQLTCLIKLNLDGSGAARRRSEGFPFIESGAGIGTGAVRSVRFSRERVGQSGHAAAGCAAVAPLEFPAVG